MYMICERVCVCVWVFACVCDVRVSENCPVQAEILHVTVPVLSQMVLTRAGFVNQDMTDMYALDFHSSAGSLCMLLIGVEAFCKTSVHGYNCDK